MTSLTMSQRLAIAGIKTVRTAGGVFLVRNGVTTRRPHVESCEQVCLALFNVVI